MKKPDSQKGWYQRRRNRERDASRGARPRNDEWREFCRLLGGCCLACGATGVVLSRDHIVPLAVGGRNDLHNLQPLCLECNNRKSNGVGAENHPDQWIDLRPQGWADLLFLLQGSYKLRREAYGKPPIHKPTPRAIKPLRAYVSPEIVKPQPARPQRASGIPGRFREVWEK